MILPDEGDWQPVARTVDLVSGHIFHGRLRGEELAIWRDAAGRANVWENRCPHRGVRLTVGSNLGSELRCRYHGMRFESGSGRCVAIPAHPGGEIPERIKVRSFPAAERYGLVWSALGEPGGVPKIESLQGDITSLRSIVVLASPSTVARALMQHAVAFGDVTLVVQSSDGSRSVVHGLIERASRAETLRPYNEALCSLRDSIEGPPK